MKHILIIGGSGRIGSLIAQELLKNPELIVMSTSVSGKSGYLLLDVTDEKSIEDFCALMRQQKMEFYSAVFLAIDDEDLKDEAVINMYQALGSRMYLCLCNKVADKPIEELVEHIINSILERSTFFFFS